ncbi:MerR family transcriptional regulator [Anaeromyxobacter sp. Red801]|uniref:MerR family transcriptional regulator n=1 Tax=Anaeromyxobacter sp. Red801 TaxID=3411632 RepID=UPI003BA0F120
MPGFYTTFEAARLLGVSLPTVVNWIEARRLKAHRTPGGHRRIAREELAAFMLRHGMPVPDELSGAAPARRKVLVVAEPGPAREGTARQLAVAGYAVEQAAPGFAAGAAAARFAPDAVVLHASGPDGGESLRAFRADRELAAVPVVAVAHADWGEPLREAGCAAAVTRPLVDGALAAAVDAALRANGPAPLKVRGGRRPRARRAGDAD